jgi:Cu-Zn family superoxide dismutase
MKHIILASLAVLGLGVFPAHAADLIGHNGKTTGTVVLQQMGKDVLIRVMAEGLTPGWHGIHIHAVGDCSDHAAFKSAGGHAMRKGEMHGIENGRATHLGDLPNLWAGADGKASAEFIKPNMNVSELQDADGSAIVIHDKADDYKSQPAGDAGARVACAVVEPPAE